MAGLVMGLTLQANGFASTSLIFSLIFLVVPPGQQLPCSSDLAVAPAGGNSVNLCALQRLYRQVAEI